MTSFREIDDLELNGKRAVLRADLNVPVADGKVTDTTRIDRAADTIKALLARGASVHVLSHFGRPKGKVVEDMSLKTVLPALEHAVGAPIRFVATDWHDDAAEIAAEKAVPGDVLLFENTRFHAGDEANDAAFGEKLAGLGDVFVNDAFSAAHRAHASTAGIAAKLPSAAGLTMAAEIGALEKALANPQRPVIAIVGGAKVSTKIDLLANLAGKVDQIVIGGGMANTFLAAKGYAIGKSLCEHDKLETAREIEAAAKEAGCEIVLPIDVVAAKAFEAKAPHRVCELTGVEADEMILDVGPATERDLENRIARARTVLWNGPLGAFELDPFDAGTNAVARAAARETRSGRLLTVAGGGDTVAALNKAGVAEDFTFVSTAGGAFLEWLEGKALPGVEALRK